MARMTEKVKLPSNGVLYGKEIPAELTVQNLTVDEEAMLYGSNGDKAIDNILDSIIKEDIDINSLITPDKHFLLVRARVLTYGPEYPLEVTCPRCGEFHYDVNLSELPVSYLDSSFINEREITLPQSKDVLTIKIPIGHDVNHAEQQVKRKVNKFGVNQAKANYISGLSMNIVKINGEEAVFDEAYQFVSELSGMDSSYLKKEINKIDVGYDTMVIAECPKCGQDVSFRLPMTGDFFRTKFDD